MSELEQASDCGKPYTCLRGKLLLFYDDYNDCPDIYISEGQA